MDTIHRERIVHSDLKPANFLVVEGQLKLIDFGIAKAIQSGAWGGAGDGQVDWPGGFARWVGQERETAWGGRRRPHLCALFS